MSDTSTTAEPTSTTMATPDASEGLFVSPLTAMPLNAYQWGFLGISAWMLMEASNIWSYKLYDIETDRAKFPKRIEGTLAYDEVWAKQTNEITAWTNAFSWLVGWYGMGTCIFTINHFYDDDGGFWHSMLYRFASVSRLAPIMTMWFSLAIRNSYARS